jgi:hypothetical protein
MPYPRATYYMLALIGVILIGFWPSYFAAAPTAPWQFHAHGIAATLWVTMVTVQAWTAHDKKRLMLHRAVGKTSLFLFPFLTAGLAAIIDRQALDYVARDPSNLAYGPGFLTGTMVAMAAYVTVYYRALKYRRKVWVHAGYMLSTPLILFESPFSRAASFVFPPFQVRSNTDFSPIIVSIEWSEVLVLIFIAAIWWRVRDRAKPFLVTAGFVVVEMLAMGFASDVPVLRQVDASIAQVPGVMVWLTGFGIGALTSWAGWNAGKISAVPAGAVPQPA